MHLKVISRTWATETQS
uniref:Uncharacterized protein n=1 Tax=Anguilla anguilla TaxID=7936 RepID=A0A0E9V8B5_ANGAN